MVEKGFLTRGGWRWLMKAGRGPWVAKQRLEDWRGLNSKGEGDIGAVGWWVGGRCRCSVE